MHVTETDQVRRFNRLISKRVGALDTSYLARGRPLSEARLLFEIGMAGGIGIQQLRTLLSLDSGRMSRLTRSLEEQGLVMAQADPSDGRARHLNLTDKGQAEFEAYDMLSEDLAASMLDSVGPENRAALLQAMSTIERLLKKASLTLTNEKANTAESNWCLQQYYTELAARFDDGFDPSLKNRFHADEMTPPKGWFVLARMDGKPAGCGAITRLPDGTAEVKRVWVAPDARGTGVATALMDRLEDIARQNGFGIVRLDTNRALPEARSLYRKRGYKEISRYNDNPYADHFFEKAL